MSAVRIRGRLAPSLAVIPHREPEADDAALIAAARQGDGAAFARLFRRHADAVRTRITRLVGPVAERDDLVQKVFIAFHRGLPIYRGDARLSTYLHRIAVNTAYDHLRGRRRWADSAGPPDAEALVEHCEPQRWRIRSRRVPTWPGCSRSWTSCHRRSGSRSSWSPSRAARWPRPRR